MRYFWEVDVYSYHPNLQNYQNLKLNDTTVSNYSVLFIPDLYLLGIHNEPPSKVVDLYNSVCHLNFAYFQIEREWMNEWLLQNDWPKKSVRPCFQPGPLPEILFIAISEMLGAKCSETPRNAPKFEHAQNLGSSFVEWRCTVVITTTPRRLHRYLYVHGIYLSRNIERQCN